MRTLALLALLSTSAFAITGSGIKLTETRKIGDFTEIEVGGGVTLEVKKGATSLTIEGDDNIVPLYVTEVVGSKLRITRKKADWVTNKNELIVRVTTPMLKRLAASGGVVATVDNVAGRDFAATLSGGVELKAKGLDADTFKLDASGGGVISADGKVKRVTLDLSGGVDVNAKSLQVAQVAVDASGGCDLEITAKESITGEISGGVSVKVWGNPPKSRVQSSGGADVQYL